MHNEYTLTNAMSVFVCNLSRISVGLSRTRDSRLIENYGCIETCTATTKVCLL